MTMTPTQREAALRYAGILEREARDHGSTDYKYSVAALLRELLAEPQGEPAAWIQPDHLQKARVAPFLCRVEPTKRMSDFVPLYAHPPQQRKPLTEEQVYEAISDQVFWATSKNFILRLVRDIERANGIGEAP